jgi:hypothetical protein
MHAIIIDPMSQTVVEADITDIRSALGCDYVSGALRLAGGDEVWVDDAAMLGRPQAAFTVDNAEGTYFPGWPFEGRGVVVGRGGGGDAQSSAKEVRRAVRFFSIWDCYVERCRLQGIPPRAPSNPWRIAWDGLDHLLLPDLEKFAALARTDIHAEGYKAGAKFAYRPVTEPITKDRLAAHLDRGPFLGTYVMPPGDKTRLATLDFDDKDAATSWDEMRAIVLRVADTTRRFGLNPWPVRSGGGRGAHLHFWWERPQPAVDVRYLLETVLEAEGFSPGTKGISKGEVEIFPKQDKIAADDYGNLIALPFGRQSKPLDEAMQPAKIPLAWPASEPVPPRPKREKKAASAEEANVDTAMLCAALVHLPADNYDRWIRYGLAIKREFGDAGFQVWDDWSREEEGAYPSEGERSAKEVWDTFKPRLGEGGITVGTIFKLARDAGWEGPPRPASNLPVIKIVPGELPRMVDEAEDALITTGAGLFRQGDRVVRVIRDTIKTSEGEAKTLRLADVGSPHLLERFAGAARWEKYNAREKKWLRADPPSDAVNAYLDRKGDERRLRPLMGVVMTPTIRPDGSLLTEPGYDAQTGLYLNTLGTEFPPVPEWPTKEEAKEALKLLKEPVSKFPFVEGANLSVWLSDFITALVRRSLPCAPMHAYSSPSAGTGKSKLVDIVAVAATGQMAAVTAPGGDEIEMEKRLGAEVLAGHAVISIDNVDEKTPLGGVFLNQCLSQPLVKVRPLGKSESVMVPPIAAFHGTGNNLTIIGDCTRRVLVARIDAKTERPELRPFDFDPVERARQRRGILVAAALTIIRAWLISGEEAKTEMPEAVTLGGYEKWSQMVRDPLIWLGEKDPMDVMEQIRKKDPKHAKLKEVAAAWEDAIGTEEKLCREVVAKAMAVETVADKERFIYPGLRSALHSIAGDGKGGGISTDRLGTWLRQNAEKMVMLDADEERGARRCRFVDAGSYRNAMRWKLEVEGELQGEEGEDEQNRLFDGC